MQKAQRLAREKKDPYLDLRVNLLRRGYSLRSFAVTFGYPVPTVYDAARGARMGVKSVKILNHLKQLAYAQ